METAMRNVSINDRHTPVQTEPDPDQPLDFSSRKNVTLSEEEILRKASKDSAISLSEDDRLSPRPTSPQNTHSPHNGDANLINRSPLIGEPRVALPPNFPMPPVSMPMGMPLMLPPQAMFPQGFMPPAFGPMWHNQMAAMMQQEAARKSLNAANFPTNIINQANIHRIKSASNGSKDNPMNGNLSAAMRSLPSMLPGMPNPLFNNPMITDPNILAEAVKSHEEMFNMYKQQVLSQKAAEEAKRVPRKSSAPSTFTSSSTNPVSQLHPAFQSQTNDTKHHNGKVDEPMDIPFIQQRENHLNGNNEAQFPCSTSAVQSSDEGKSSTESICKHQNSDSAHSSTNQLHSHLPNLDEAASSSEGRRSLTPAYYHNGVDVMRPRSSTLPCKPGLTSLSNSPTPSLLSSGTTTPNKGSFRKRARTLPDEQKVRSKDEAYWERRRKNNEAAKRSRDSRRSKEDEIAIRAAFLEQENIRLRVELASLRQQTSKLRSELIIYQTPEELNAENLSRDHS